MSTHATGAGPRSVRSSVPVPTAAVVWGVIIGAVQAASPLAVWWLAPSTVYALGLAVIASVYIGFAVADGRTKVLVVEIGVAAVFVVAAATAVSGSSWIFVAWLAAHGLKDLWQHRTQFVRNTRWWPPFCVTVDFVAAAVLAVLLVTGADFHA
ncbi:hypothetical protein [Arthrobacter sp. CAN_C5]|uniref:hypothetical protein n=1 Tax=Arthrobacter sp. CAN_C5 TaxID=2760706 RepID=UPI001AE57454|nr:hypothetical protein [Arthrobacter sp. CAN_C5]MBP2216976.1 hypothetical protein [Arthrobacter sp. CAN_C5]